MRQVAVDESVRGKNVGKQMVIFAEEAAKREGFTTIVLNAREAAISFYEKLDYLRLEINLPR